MLKFIIGRLLSAIPVLLIVSLLTLSLVWLVPGDAAAEMAGVGATQDEVARIRTQMGLDKSLTAQAVDWYGNLLHGDLGQSLL
ncbi:MAG: peptide transporter, partial [Rhodoferax sp.]|nr:peptide transporter [Rhodoferax sp.]